MHFATSFVSALVSRVSQVVVLAYQTGITFKTNAYTFVLVGEILINFAAEVYAVNFSRKTVQVEKNFSVSKKKKKNF